MIAVAEPPCHLCGQPIDYTLKWVVGPSGVRIPDPMSFVVDHVMPLKLGGSDTLENKAASHRACNSKKGAREYAPIIRRSSALTNPAAVTQGR